MRGASSGMEVGGRSYAPGPADDMLGNPHGAEDTYGDFSEDEAGGSEVEDADDGDKADGASGVSDGSGGIAPVSRHANPGGAPRIQASPVSTTDLKPWSSERAVAPCCRG